MEIVFILAWLAGAAPGLIFWITVIILSAIVLHRTGGRAERFLLAGVILMAVNTLFNVPSGLIVPWLIDTVEPVIDTKSVFWFYSLANNLVAMSGILCLAYGFWVKFKANRKIHSMDL